MTDPYMPPAISHAVVYAGKFYGVSYYDEGGRVTSVVDLVNGTVGDGGSYILGLEQHGGLAICANSTYVYATQWVQGIKTYADEWPTLYPSYTDYGGNIYDVDAWEGVQRRLRSTMAPSVFTGGKLQTFQGGDTTGCMKVLYEYQYLDHNNVLIPRDSAEMKGIACTETEVFVSHPYQSKIYVLDAETMGLLRTLTIAGAGHLAIAADGNLWCIIGSAIKKIDKTTGAILATVTPSAAFSKIGVLSNGKLWHDSTVDFKIRIRDSAGSAVETTFGNSILAAGGTITDSAPNLGPTIGFDYDGTYYYVLHGFDPSGYGTLATKYNSSGIKQHELRSTHFLETGDIDVAAGKYYSRYHRWSFNKDANPQTTLEAYTYDQTNNAADYRGVWFTVSTYFREIFGKKFLYEFSQMGRQLTFREIVSSTNRNRPAGMYSTNGFWRPTDDGTLAPNLPTEYIADPRGNDSGIWLNGYVDTEGTVWTTVISYPHTYVGFGNGFSLQRHVCLGLDANNNPIYNWTTGFEEIPTDGLLGDNGEDDVVIRFYYDPPTDTAILTGYTASLPGDLYDPDAIYRYRYEGCGTVIRCYGNWRGIRGPRYTKWKITPDIGGAILIKSLHFAKHVLALGFMAEPRVELRLMTTGELIKTIPTTDPDTGVNTYWIDAHHGIRVVSLDDAGLNYRILHERGISGAGIIHSLTLRN
jgi:hypothetical protein